MERIAHILEKCKRGVLALFEAFCREDIFLMLIITLVGFGSFGLGRLSQISEEKAPVRIYKESALSGVSRDTGDAPTQIPKNKQFVASVSGTKYHLPWCSGAVRIKEENKVWFSSKEEAEAAGYTPAANCKGI